MLIFLQSFHLQPVSSDRDESFFETPRNLGVPFGWKYSIHFNQTSIIFLKFDLALALGQLFVCLSVTMPRGRGTQDFRDQGNEVASKLY